MGTMPKIGRDPFEYAEDYARNSNAMGAQNEQNAQNSLMRMFVTEARRQLPMVELPTDLAKTRNSYDLAFRNSVDLAGAKAALKPVAAPSKIGNMIKASARTLGFDPDIAMTVASLESNFDPTAVSPTGAKGVFQVTSDYSKDYGITDPFNVQQNIDGSMRGMVDAAQRLQQAGIPVNAGTIYLAHQQGVGGAVKLLSNPNVPAEQLVGRQAVVVNGGRPGMSAKAFADMWINKANKTYERYAALHGSNQQNNNSAQFIYGGKVVSLGDDLTADPVNEEDNAS